MSGTSKSNRPESGHGKNDPYANRETGESEPSMVRDGAYTVVKDVGDTVSELLYPTPKTSESDLHAKHKDALRQIKELRTKMKSYVHEKTHKKR